MPDATLACPFGDCRKTIADRHEHPYTPPLVAQQQCTCGSRRWSVTVGGPRLIAVYCARCTKQSRISTAYELGRDRGRREAPRAAD